MPMITVGGAAVQGAVWNGERGMLPGPFRGSHGKDVENEEIQTFLVAAWRHSAVGGDRLQQELHQRRRQLWTERNGRSTACLRRNGLPEWPNRRSWRNNVSVLDVSRHGGYAERFVLVLIWVERRLCAEYGLANAAGPWRNSLNGIAQPSLTSRKRKRRKIRPSLALPARCVHPGKRGKFRRMESSHRLFLSQQHPARV